MRTGKKKKLLFFIILINMAFLVIFGITSLLGRQDDITLSDIPLYSSDGLYANGEDHIFSTDYPVSRYWFAAQTGPLTSGVYTVRVFYNADRDVYSVSCGSDASDGEPYPVVYAESYTLSALYHSFEYRIWVNSAIDHLNIRVDCGGGDDGDFDNETFFKDGSYLYLDKIEIVRDYRETVFYRFVRLVFFFLFPTDCIVAVLWNLQKIKENIAVVLGLSCVFIVSSLGVMGCFVTEGHDYLFHYARIVGLAEGLMSGELPVRIQPGWLHGYGYAASVCYGDLLLYVPALLYALGLPIIHAYKCYVLLINLGTLLISYFCFKKIGRSRPIAVACSALYCLCVTRLINLYLRAAVGEYSAFMFLPLVLLGMKEIYAKDRRSESLPPPTDCGWLILCLGMTGLIRTHVLSVEMTGIFLALTVLLLIRRMSKQVFLALCKSVLATLLLNLDFLLPFLDYAGDSLKVFAAKTSYGIQQYGLSLYELLSFGTTAAGKATDALSGPVARIPESLGPGILAAVLLIVIVLAKGNRWGKNEKGQLILTAGLGCLAIILTTYYFPWNRLAALPVLNSVTASIQFPWRFLSIAVPLLTYAACIALVKFEEIFGREKLTYALIVLCGIAALQGMYFQDLVIRNAGTDGAPQDSVIYYDSRPQMNLSAIVSSGEYLLENTNVSLTWTDLDVTGENVQILQTEKNGLTTKIVCEAAENAWLEIPMFAYRHYRCGDVDTGEELPVSRGTNNKIRVDLPDNYRGVLRVYFSEPWYWRASELISLVTLVWLTRSAACLLKAWRCRNRSAG